MTWRSIGEIAAQVVEDTLAKREQRFDPPDKYATEMRRAEGVLAHSASALTETLDGDKQ